MDTRLATWLGNYSPSGHLRYYSPPKNPCGQEFCPSDLINKNQNTGSPTNSDLNYGQQTGTHSQVFESSTIA